MFRDPKPPEICPVCGEEVPPKALACPECGADYNSGWREDALLYDGLDLPDREAGGDFRNGANSYEEFMRREFGPRWNWWPPTMKWVWWIAAVLLLISSILAAGGLEIIARLMTNQF